MHRTLQKSQDLGNEIYKIIMMKIEFTVSKKIRFYAIENWEYWHAKKKEEETTWLWGKKKGIKGSM